MSLGARLREERERLGYNQTDFAALAGASKWTQIDWEKDKTSPSGAALATFAAAGVDVLYVLTGQRQGGAAAPISREEEALLDNFRHCPEEGRAAILQTSNALAKSAAPASTVKKKKAG